MPVLTASVFESNDCHTRTGKYQVLRRQGRRSSLTVPVHESNDCHTPPGSPEGGQFCSDTSLRHYPYEQGSQKIPAYLKRDVKLARQAGIAVYHHQQPEPVKDVTGAIHDPLAKSHAKGGAYTYFKDGAKYYSPTGRIFISTRGGVWEPTYQSYENRGSFYHSVTKTKDLTPSDLLNPASIDDVVSTFRHEVGHLMDREFGGRKSTPAELAREIRAWQYAVEASPDHKVSETMVRRGLMSHAYSVFRKQELAKESYYSRLASWDRDEALERALNNEVKSKIVDGPTQFKARQFTARVLKSLRNYGAVLRKKGIVRVPRAEAPWFPERKLPLPGPGRGGLL